ATLLLPPRLRESVIVLRALNLETALVREAVRDVRLGRGRLQFWRDAVAAAARGHPPDHPVARALAAVFVRHQPSSRWLTRLVEARERNLDDRPCATMAEAERYAEDTAASLL